MADIRYTHEIMDIVLVYDIIIIYTHVVILNMYTTTSKNADDEKN